MHAQNFNTYIGWWPVWSGLLVVCLLLAPLLIARRFRLGYAAVLCILAIVLVGALWVRNLGMKESATVVAVWQTSQSRESVGLDFASGGGGISFAFIHWRAHNPDILRETPRRSPLIAYQWNDSTGGRLLYPTWAGAIFNRWGFQISFMNQPDRPGKSSTPQLWAIIMPDWFAILLLSIVPAFWVRRRLRRRYRRIHNLCLVCGFDRRAHQPTDPCPECGTVPDALKKPTTSLPVASSGS
jgi:hypothetical protein